MLVASGLGALHFATQFPQRRYDKVIERCMKDEYSLFRSRLCSNRDSNGEYESFVQSSITISIVQMVFLSRFAENRDRKHHPCDRRVTRSVHRPDELHRRSRHPALDPRRAELESLKAASMGGRRV